MNYWLIFLTGLTSGSFSCLAVQGGLLTAAIASQDPKTSQPFIPSLMFTVSKLAAYTVLGAFLGYFGSLFQITPQLQAWFLGIAAIFMFALAGNMLNLHPIFRYFVLQPPHFIGRWLRTHARHQHLFTPAVLGLFTIFIPCSVTQAMEILAVSSGRPAIGALIMFSFILGTSPIFLALGWITDRLSAAFRRLFFKFAGAVIVFIAFTTLNSSLVLAGSRYSLDNWLWAFKNTFLTQALDKPANQFTINATSRGYFPNRLTVKAGEPVTLDLTTSSNFSCTSVFTIPSLGINRSLPPTGNTQVTFTPTRRGPLVFSCGMGMFTGIIDVI